MNKKVAAGIGLLAGALGLYLWTTKKAKPTCTEGARKCVGADLYACVNGKWVLTEANSPICVTPPSCSVDADCPPGYVCENGVCVPTSGGELPEGFYVETIVAEPSVVVLGNEVKIHVTYELPDGVDVRPYIGKTYQVHCTIDGTTLTISVGPIPYFPIDAHFAYTPRSIGIYTATVLDKSVSFEVRVAIIGPFYSPFGGCTSYSTLDALAGFIAFDEDLWKSESAPGQNNWIDYITCPYCSATFATPAYFGAPPYGSPFRLTTTYALLDHIQSSHPDCPLTEPAKLAWLVLNIPTNDWYLLAISVNDISVLYARGGFLHVGGTKTVQTALGHYVVKVSYAWTTSDQNYPPEQWPGQHRWEVDILGWGDTLTLQIITGETSYRASPCV